jgi:hypothetical protein
MKYSVTWKADAENELAEVWLRALDRPSVTRAGDEIDRLLAADPTRQGESRAGTMRIMFVDPLGVIFHVSEQDLMVTVVRVWSVI